MAAATWRAQSRARWRRGRVIFILFRRNFGQILRPRGHGNLACLAWGLPGCLRCASSRAHHTQHRAPLFEHHSAVKLDAPGPTNPTETAYNNTMARSKPIQSKTTTSDRPRRTIVPPRRHSPTAEDERPQLAAKKVVSKKPTGVRRPPPAARRRLGARTPLRAKAKTPPHNGKPHPSRGVCLRARSLSHLSWEPSNTDDTVVAPRRSLVGGG